MNKFNYTPIEREMVNGFRHYATPTGQKLPSVTTVLSNTKPEEDKQILENWRKRVGETKANEITTEAANRGTRMHFYLEHYILDGNIKERGKNPFSWQSHDMAQTIIDNGLKNVNEYWGTEVPLYYPGLYAGTTDCVGVHENKPSIIDFKQTNKPKKTEYIDDYFIQLCMYANAHNVLHGTNIQRGVIMMCVKPDEEKPGVYSNPPQYQQWILEGENWKIYEQKMWKRLELYYSKFA